MTQSEPRDLLVVFGTVQRVMRAERAAREQQLDVDVVPAPRSVSSECGVVLEARRSQAAELRALLATLELTPQHVYRRDPAGWLPSSLEAPRLAGPQLTLGSRYGGCGAKLARGVLSSVLCGLPRLESPDLLVGIEFADDAGVVRVRPDLAVIHTVDFFPPPVDDPFTFGRIAAANALSDIYAMGGTPLAGMNLVSYPLARLGKEPLKEVLRGGLSALQEAGALLAGGHTVDGEELLYGVAVTGTIHPDRIWRNGGAHPGDLLVLTKPLGTGVVTTAARAEAVTPDQLTAAVRSMSELNRAAAEALHDLEPHAVTDVTGFGLVGHSAELALASGLTCELDLAALPLLPGAYQAAGMGFVPAGAAKNRSSVAESWELEEGLDPLLLDLACDPQTSGGLLAACTPAAAKQLCLRLPAARVVGRCLEGPAGRLRLRLAR